MGSENRVRFARIHVSVVRITNNGTKRGIAVLETVVII